MSCVKYFTCISASLLYRCTACCSCACIYHRSCCRISTQHLKISLTTWSADEATPLVIVCDLGPYSRSFCSDSCFLSLGWSEELNVFSTVEARTCRSHSHCLYEPDNLHHALSDLILHMVTSRK